MLTNYLLAITALFTFSLGLLVFINSSKKSSNKEFFYFTTMLTGWTIVNIFANITAELNMALFWSRTTVVFGALIPYYLLLFSFSFPIENKITKFKKIALFVPAFVLVILSYTDLNISSATAYAAEIKTGLVYTIFVVYLMTYAVWSIVSIVQSSRKTHGMRKEQAMYLLAAIISLAVPSVIIAGILPVVGITQLASITPIFVIPMVAIMSYAMLRHQLMDIRVIVTRSLAFIFSMAIIGVLYGVIAFQVLTRILPSDTSASTLQVFYTLLAIFLAFTFQPIRLLFEKATDAVFYRDKYDPQQLINSIGLVLVEEIVIDDLCNKIAKELQNKMKITHIDIIVFNKKEMVFKTNNSAIVASTKLLEDLRQLPSGLNYSEDLSPGTKLQVLKKHKITICLELKTSEGFLGYILFGDKQSGQIYNEVDKKTLTIVAGELSIALENANAFLEISNFNTTLQHKVDSATSNLKQANLQLKELDEAKDEFISMASHQLRTPLTTVKGYVSMLDEGDFGKLTKEQQQTIVLVLDGSNRMARLIDDLLNISRMEAGKFYIDAQKLDLYKIVSEEFESLKNFAVTKKVHIALVKPKSEVPIMLLDENKTRQVVMNLIDNAINYSQPPSGGGKAEITLEQVGKQIVFKVIDNGIGVPADQQPKLFTKMFRARNAKEVRPDGTGLGLYLVKRVIEDQGGKIIFKSKPGKGSEFGFSIPIHNSIKHNKSAEAKLKAQSNSAPE